MDEVLFNFYPVDFQWVNRVETFASMICQMYDHKEQMDLMIKLDNGKKMQAHRHVLAIVSTEIMALLDKQLNYKGNFDAPTSEIELPAIPYNIMKQILKYVYRGSVDVREREIHEFCNATNKLGITMFDDHEIERFITNVDDDKGVVKIVYQQRCLVLAEGFQKLFCAGRMFDIAIENHCIPIQSHRIALSAGSPFFYSQLKKLPPTTAETNVAIVASKKQPTFENTFKAISFIYGCEVKVIDVASFLSDCDCLEILGMRKCDKHDDVPGKYEILATAIGIPVDHPISETNTYSSSSSVNGSEYDVAKDSDNYSGSDDAMPLAKQARRQQVKRAAKSSKTHRPRHTANSKHT